MPLALAAGVPACSSLPAATAATTGCNEEDVSITDQQDGPSGESWTARCHRHVYDCVREEKPFEAEGWNIGKLEYEHLQGTQVGDTYCMQRE